MNQAIVETAGLIGFFALLWFAFSEQKTVISDGLDEFFDPNRKKGR